MLPNEITTERGVVIRNLIQVPNSNYTHGYAYNFQALIKGEWWECGGPCGDWSYVKKTGGKEPPEFSVKVGWWELDRIYKEKSHER